MNTRLRCFTGFTLLTTLLGTLSPALAERPVLTLTRLQTEEANIRIDGVLDEAAWQQAPRLQNLKVIEPDTLAEPTHETQVQIFYTDDGIYVGIWNAQPDDTIVARLSPRDEFITRDGNSFTLDPGGKGLYAYWFGVNLGDSLADGTVLPERQYSNQWDGAWRGASARGDGGWSSEFFVPWSIMTMPDTASDTRRMGFYMSRRVGYLNERWALPAIPRTQPVFLSDLVPLEIQGVTPSKQFTFYPYASSTYDRAADRGRDSYKGGFDMFWRPTSNLQVTATVNPDFGNVESDKVVVNLSSFETFFAEKRAFFLEGSEIFTATPRAKSDNREPTTMVNTRRIGGPPKLAGLGNLTLTALEANQPSELFGAAKVTGQNGNLRYGVLAAFEEDTRLQGTIDNTPVSVIQDGRDFGIARVLYEDTQGGARRGLGWLGTLVTHPSNDAVVNGIDGHYLSSTGRWTTDMQVLFSDVDGVTGAGGFFDVTYQPQQGREHTLTLEYFDENLQINDLGFLRRNDTQGIHYQYQRNDSSNARYKTRQTNFMVVHDYNRDGRAVRLGYFASQERAFHNNHFLFYEFNYFPARWDDINSNGNGSYKLDDRIQAGVFYETDQARPLSFDAGLFFFGEFIGGVSKDTKIGLRWQPTDRFSLRARLAYIARDGWLLHSGGRDFTRFDANVWQPELEMNFFISARQQFRLTAQWAGIKAFEADRWTIPAADGELDPVTRNAGDPARDFSISQLTFQARYRWEIAPLSDLFVVYTRGSNLPSRVDDDFNELLSASWSEPLVDLFVVKLRYRLGN